MLWKAWAVACTLLMVAVPADADEADCSSVACPEMEAWACTDPVQAGDTLTCDFTTDPNGQCLQSVQIYFADPLGGNANPGTFLGYDVNDDRSWLNLRFAITDTTAEGVWHLASYTVNFRAPDDASQHDADPCDNARPDPDYEVPPTYQRLLIENDYAFTVGPLAGDRDGDGVPDVHDNCPDDANSDQADLDGDGLGNICDPDMDGDGLGNADEEAWPCLDPASGADGATGDEDQDGLSNGAEVAGGTSPCDYDTDGDGQGDGYETAAGSDPTNPGSFVLPGGLVFTLPGGSPVPVPEW